MIYIFILYCVVVLHEQQGDRTLIAAFVVKVSSGGPPVFVSV